MVSGPMPDCMACVHYHRDSTKHGLTCDAYPEGIPDEIILGGVQHREPYPGDNGIRFEPIEQEEPEREP